jgi:DNA-binding IclR family transcriptional regulator
MSSAGSQTVERALDLLGCFSADEPEHTATELSLRTGLTIPTTHRLLKALSGRRFLVLDQATKRYSLGPAVMQLAGAILERDNLLEIVIPALERLRRASGETAGLLWLVDWERVCLVERVSHQSIRMSSGVGRAYPLHAGASGKILMASLPDDERRAYLNRVLKDRGVNLDRADVERSISDCIERGYAVSEGEVYAGAAAIAAALHDSTGYPIGAINVSGPDSRWTSQRMTEFAPRLVAAVEDIESQLSYSRDL